MIDHRTKVKPSTDEEYQRSVEAYQRGDVYNEMAHDEKYMKEAGFEPPEDELSEDELSEDDAEDDTERDRSDSGLRMSDDAEPLIPQEFGQRLGKLLKKKRTS